MFGKNKWIKYGRVLTGGALIALLAACGGGSGGDSGCANIDPNRDPSLPSCGAPPPGSGTGGSGGTAQPAALGSISFVSAEPTNIALKGTGGVGRQEFSKLTFQVFDQLGNPLIGQQVSFTLNTTAGGLAVLPASATTDAEGKVTTVVSAGTQPTPVVTVTAAVPGTSVSTVSNALVVSSGVVIKNRTSISLTASNIEALNFDGVCTDVRMAMADHFGNPPADGTVVSFTSPNGVVGSSCLSDPSVGACSVQFCSGGTRPANGRSVVMGFLLGEEDFFDANGNNVCDGCDAFGTEFRDADPVTGRPSDDLSPDIFRDDNENGFWNAGEPCIGPNQTGVCTTPGDQKYNGVLRSTQTSQQTTYINQSAVVIWSGSDAIINVSPTPITCPAGGTRTLTINVADVNGNPMPADTTITYSALFGPTAGTVQPGSDTVPGIVVGVGSFIPPNAAILNYQVTLGCPTPLMSGSFKGTVTTPKGVVSTASFSIN